MARTCLGVIVSTGHVRSENVTVVGESLNLTCGRVCVENGARGRRLGQVPLDQRDNVDDTSGRSTGREFGRLSRVLQRKLADVVVDMATEHSRNVLDDSGVGSSAGARHDVEGLETRSLEPSPRTGEGSGGGGIHNYGLDINSPSIASGEVIYGESVSSHKRLNSFASTVWAMESVRPGCEFMLRRGTWTFTEPERSSRRSLSRGRWGREP